MDKDSILDLLALIQTESVTQAAQTRNTSQSAYSRRLQALEHLFGAALVDRTRRPSRPTFLLNAMQPELEAALAGLNRLSDAFTAEMAQPLRIAAPHSISANILPRALMALDKVMATHDIHLRAADLENCFQMLMTEQVSTMLSYETVTKRLDPPKDLVQRTSIGFDRFIPVCAADWRATLDSLISDGQPVPLVCYSPEIFMGELTRSTLLPKLPHKATLKIVSGLTQTVQNSILCGLGCGWLPGSTASDFLKSGALVRLDDHGFASASLELVMLRLKTRNYPDLGPTVEAICHEVSRILSAV